ncbi:MAG: putative metal-binding motif-containing protein [Myxococcales bacterium]|nr:putative metal-binding motif-containing protein [Myxococcales bacterium]
MRRSKERRFSFLYRREVRFLCWLLVLVAGCSLAGEARFYRPSATSDAATVDGAASDVQTQDVPSTDAVISDGPRDAETDADAGAACIPIGPEVCNGVDDDCDGTRDNVQPLATLLDCAAPPLAAGGPPRLGVFRGCTCVPVAASPEICGNGLDDNGNGSADEGCGCDAIVIPTSLTGFPRMLLGAFRVFATVDDALANLSATSQRTICLLSTGLRDCSVRVAHTYNIRVPANVTIRGGYVPGVILTGAPELRPTCRTELRGTITFDGSNTNSVVTNVHVNEQIVDGGSAVSMPGDGWFVDSSIEGRASSFSANVGAISTDGTGLHRVVRNVTVALSGGADVTGLFVARGRIWAENVRFDITAGRRSTAIDLDHAAPSVLNAINVATLNGAELTEAVHISEAPPYVAINGLSGSAGRSMVGRGLTIDCRDGSESIVQVANANWLGSLAPDSLGALVRGCHAEFSAPDRPSVIASSASADPGAAGSVAVALRCELGARCVTLSAAQPLAFRALSSRGSVATTRGAAIVDRASAVVVGTTFDGSGSIASSTGFEMEGRVLFATHSEFVGGRSTSADGSRALQIKQATNAVVSTSVLRAARGVGASIEASGVGELLFFSNTVTAINTDANVSPTQLVIVRGARSPASIRFENNLLACSNLPTSNPMMVPSVGLVIDGTSPFNYFGYNMIGGCGMAVRMSDQVLVDQVTAQSRVWAPLGDREGQLQLATTTLAIDATTGWRLTSSSPAVSKGSPAALGPDVRDFERTLRGPLAPADIGADER